MLPPDAWKDHGLNTDARRPPCFFECLHLKAFLAGVLLPEVPRSVICASVIFYFLELCAQLEEIDSNRRSKENPKD